MGAGLGTGLGVGSGVWTDVRYALRQLGSAPGFALTAVLTLALTVGLAATVFSVFDAVLVRPLPFGNVSRLMAVDTFSAQGYSQPATWPEYRYWRDHAAPVLDIAGEFPGSANLQFQGQPSPVRTIGVTPNFFRVMDVKPLLGRTFLPSEGEYGRTDVAVLSYELWQNRFGGNANVLGSKIDLDGKPMTVVGIAPEGFTLNATQVVFEPIAAAAMFASEENAVGDYWLPVVARLQPGVSQAQAQAGLQQALVDYARTLPMNPELMRRRAQLMPIAQKLLGTTSGLLWQLSIAVLAVLLLGCINIAGLMLARGLRRERELVLRSALGAPRLRLVRQLLVEICLLAVGGTLGGLVLASGLLATTRDLLVASMERGAGVQLNFAVFAASLLASLLTLLIAGALPMRQILRVAPASALRSGSQGSGASSRSRRRLRAVFLASQVALAMLLLSISAILLATLHSLRDTTLGFQADHLLIEDISLTPNRNDALNPYPLYYQPLLQKLRAIPGIADAGLTTLVPVQDSGSNSEITIIGQPPAPAGENTLAELRLVSPDYFRTMGARRIAGRLFTDALDHPGTLNTIVNQAFVRKFLPRGVDPLGRKINNLGGLTIVGVVSNMRQSLFKPAMPEYDVAAAAFSTKETAAYLSEMHVVIRTAVPPAQLREPLRQAMESVDPTVPYRPALTMDGVMGVVLTMQRLEGWLFGSFAALAVVLAMLGLYGLIAQEVEQGRRDIGIRMALGAARRRVMGDVLGRIAVVAACGLAVGGVLVYVSRQVLGAILPVHAPHAALLCAALACAMELLAICAAFAPARRAASVDPIEVLRAE